MNIDHIGAIVTVILFILAGVAGARAAHSKLQAEAHLRETDKLDPEGVNYRDFLLRARRFERVESRWDSVGIVSLLGMIIVGTLTVIHALSGTTL